MARTHITWRISGREKKRLREEIERIRRDRAHKKGKRENKNECEREATTQKGGSSAALNRTG